MGPQRTCPKRTAFPLYLRIWSTQKSLLCLSQSTLKTHSLPPVQKRQWWKHSTQNDERSASILGEWMNSSYSFIHSFQKYWFGSSLRQALLWAPGMLQTAKQKRSLVSWKLSGVGRAYDRDTEELAIQWGWEGLFEKCLPSWDLQEEQGEGRQWRQRARW